MGIKYLNQYLLKKCSRRAICPIPLSHLGHKTIVIDAFIYLYKYLAEDRLLERFQELLALTHKHHIHPIFVFDGKPPEEKRPLLNQRRENRLRADQLYREALAQDVQDPSVLTYLKRQSIQVTSQHVNSVKALLQRGGAVCLNAPAEADAVCVAYVRQHKAWACMSDDMDMFVYGCPRVLRSLSLDEECVDLYDLPTILRELRMSMNNFRQIMILSGTDYTTGPRLSLFDALRWFRHYKHSGFTTTQRASFYDWLKTNSTIMNDQDQVVLNNLVTLYRGNF